MKIAINTSPLNSGHKNRGIGQYTANLLEFFKKDQSLEVVEFQDISKVENVDLVHYPWFDFYFHTLPIKKKFPTIITIHDVIPLIFKNHHPAGIKGRLNFILQNLALKSCKAYITDSQASKRDVSKYLKISDNKISSIPLAAEEDFRSLSDTKLLYVKRKFNLPDQFLLYVGDANWVKNLPFLIEGFKKIRSNNDKLYLCLVGAVFLKNVEDFNHPELQSLKIVNKLIKEYKLEDRVIRPGRLEKQDLIAFYNLATLYIQPSFYEGFGLPVLEAQASGCPVICSEGGSLKEVGGEAAVYFNPTNLNQFISIINEVLPNKSLREKLSNMGLKHAQQFSWQKMAEETKEVYQRILSK